MREGTLQVSRATGRHMFVLGGATLLLRALSGQQVTKAGSATHQLAGSGQFEALGDGFFGLLHEES